MFIDSHCHLNFKTFRKDLFEVIKRAKKAKIEKMVIPGAKIDSSKRGIKIAQKYPSCFATVGIHPHHVSSSNTPPYNNIKQEILFLAKQPKVIAIGEIGLDYHQYKNHSPISEKEKQKQKKLLIAQIKIAQEKNLPIIFHCRDAYNDLINLITDYIKTSSKPLSGVFHCFEGNKKHLKKILNLGFYIGFDGNITYQENNFLRELVKLTPIKSLLLETDAPFLTPLPYKKTRNEPSYLPFIASIIARVKKQTLEKIAQTTSCNATRLFHV